MSLIDLDQPGDRAPTGKGRTPLRWAVAALLVGAVAGGLVTHLWTVRQQRATDARTVSVLLIATPPTGNGAVDIITNGDGVVQMTFGATVAVVNAGPRTVEMQSLAAEKPGVLVAGSARSTEIAPGTSLPVPVGITANCVVHEASGDTRATVGRGTLPVTVSVRTAEGSVVVVSSLSLDTGPWTAQFRSANAKCLRP
ncbi:MAG: hypothetical protein ABW046_21315 [Actinoplanes sp.]